MMPALQSFPHMADGGLYGGPALFLGGEKSSFILPEHLTVIRSIFPTPVIKKLEKLAIDSYGPTYGCGCRVRNSELMTNC